MRTEEFIEFAKTQGITDIQITEKNISHHLVEVINDKLNNNELDETITYLVKATINDKTVSVTTEVLDELTICLLKEKALYLEKPLEQLATDTNTNNRETKIPLEDLTEVTEKIINQANQFSLYPSLKTVTTTIETCSTLIRIINNYGVCLMTSNQYTILAIEAVAENSQKSVSKQYQETKKRIAEFDLESIYQNLLTETVNSLTKHPLPTQKTNIILKGEAMATLLKQFIKMISADNIRKDLSILKGELDKQIFSKHLTIVENPQEETKVGYRYFDDEGVITQNKTIIENGVLKSYLWNKEEANLSQTTSTGNSYNNTIAVTNCYLVPNQEKTVQQLLTELDCGVVIESIIGNVGGINPKTGTFSFQAFGYLVESGKFKHYIEPCIFSSDIKETFSHILAVANDLKFKEKTIGSPSVLIENMNLVGKIE